MFLDWGRLVFFDIEEHQIPDQNQEQILAAIPKLGTQWKIIYELKPTEYLQEAQRFNIGLFGKAGTPGPSESRVQICFMSPNTAWFHWVREGSNVSTLGDLELPRVGKWTKIEISQEEVEGKYYLAFSVGGTEVKRMEADPFLRNQTDVKVCVGYRIRFGCPANQPGFIRRLVILEKR